MKNLTDVPVNKLAKLRMRLLPLSEKRFPISVLHEELPKNSQTPAVFHRKTHEYAIVLKGSATIILDGRAVKIRKGSIFDIPAGAVHQFKTGRSAVEALSIFSPPMSKKKPDVHLVHDKTLEVRLS